MMNHFFLPFRGVFCRVSPIAFDGTLSFLELICKLQHYVNELANNLNDLETALEEFEQYVNDALDGKQDLLEWDETPTANSTNPVYSYGIKNYVDEGLATKQDTLEWDETPTTGSYNPVYSNGIKAYIDSTMETIKLDIHLTYDEETQTYSVDKAWSAIYLASMRGAIVTLMWNHGTEFSPNFDFMSLENFNHHNATFANNNYSVLIDDHGIVTVTSL